MRPREIVRFAALSAVSCWSLAMGMQPEIDRNRVQFLCLHHLKPQHRPRFSDFLTMLARDHRLIPYSEAVQRVVHGPIDAPYIAFGIDDGFKSGLETAEVLADYGARACFFVCPSIIGETRPEVLEAFCRSRLHVPCREFLSWNDVERLRREGHEVGSHSMTHPDLGAVPKSLVEDEIGASYEALHHRLGSVGHFAWPYGRLRNFSATAAAAVFRAGYISCVSSERGCHVQPQPNGARGVMLLRDNIDPQWPIRHSLYFLARSSRVAAVKTFRWPDDWVAELKKFRAEQTSETCKRKP